MAAPIWAAPFRLKNLLKIWPIIILATALFVVRWTKGAAFADFYALALRPFWPGTAQKHWIESGLDIQLQSKLRLLEQDNQRLRALLSLERASGEERISAPVISRVPGGWWQQIELGKGRVDGIMNGAPVLGPGGLIGIVESATPFTSRVRLLTSPKSRIGVWVPRLKRHGILTGVGTSRPKLVFLEKDPQVRPGDLISTSPASTLLPPNVPIGVLQSFDSAASFEPSGFVQLIASPEAIDWVQIQVR